jgi:predicted outer membrane lipoprotein
MTIFYWVMGVLIACTFVPSVFYLLLYAITGEDACARRASALWDYSKLLFGFGVNIVIWGHVVVGLWHIWFH